MNHQTKNQVGRIGLNNHVPWVVVDVVDEVIFFLKRADP